MGVIHAQMVICTTYDYSNKRDELDAFVEYHPKLFTKSQVLANHVINYVMFWDGSKEGWDESDEGDKLRQHFINLVKKLDWAHLYEIDNFEHENPQFRHTFVFRPENHNSSKKVRSHDR